MPTTTAPQGHPSATALTAHALTPHTLTSQERELLYALGCGLEDAEIADALALPEHEVAAQLGRVLVKLGLRDRTAAIVHAFDCGLVVPGQGPRRRAAARGRRSTDGPARRRPVHGSGSPCSARCGPGSQGSPWTWGRSGSRPCWRHSR
ncbi:helix-turn-helix transcriptional regulator [Streptomyces sp. MS1.AVA.1]|uniref:Helix-turn-helix transcriptional regulator n=1 Tax=Streptomyces machairae TaxID=3134109 RepID=A0ABU8UKR6_9ACTN